MYVWSCRNWDTHKPNRLLSGKTTTQRSRSSTKTALRNALATSPFVTSDYSNGGNCARSPSGTSRALSTPRTPSPRLWDGSYTFDTSGSSWDTTGSKIEPILPPSTHLHGHNFSHSSKLGRVLADGLFCAGILDLRLSRRDSPESRGITR